jgi:tetratricopeptide (TPR) repeat protein
MLMLFLSEAPGFRLGLAAYDVPETRERYLRELAEAVGDGPIHMTRLDLSRSSDEDLLLHRLQDHLEADRVPEGKHPAVMVTGLESAIDFHRVPGLESFRGGPLLRNANVQRDAYPSRCPVPVVLWLNSWGYAAFAQAAPDLWHWRLGTFPFSGEPRRHADYEPISITIPFDSNDRLPREGLQERIGMLQGLNLQLENAEDRETFGNKARRARLQLEQGKTLDRSSDFRRAISYYERSLNLFRTIADLRGEMNALSGLADAYEASGQFEQSIACLERALSIAQQVGDRRSEARSLGDLGNVLAWSGQVDQAISHYERALMINREIGDRMGVGIDLNGLGNAYELSGQAENARAHYEEAAIVAHEIGDRRFETVVSANLGNVYYRLDRIPQAVTCYEQSLVIARDLGDRRSEGAILSNLGVALSRLGSIDRAIKSFEASLEIAEEFQDQRLIDSASTRLAELGSGPIRH